MLFRRKPQASPDEPAALQAALTTPWARQGEWGGTTLSRSLTYGGIQARTADWTGVRVGYEAFLHCGETTYIGAGQFPRFAAAYRAALDEEESPLASFCVRFDVLLKDVARLLIDLRQHDGGTNALVSRYMRLHQEMQPYSYVFGYGEELVVADLVRSRLAAARLSPEAVARAERAAFAPTSDIAATRLLMELKVPDATRSLLHLTRRQARVRTERRELWNQVETAVGPHLHALARRLDRPARLLHEATHEELRLAIAGDELPSARELEARLDATFLAHGGRISLLTGEAHRRVAQSLAGETAPTVDELRGVVGHPGRVEGRVRIVTTAEASDALVQGEVLVSDMTTPELATACGRAAAIVTDRGGMLCHAAIVSRELGIPCVLGTEHATRVLRDGDLVLVDATRGVVTRLSRD